MEAVSAMKQGKKVRRKNWATIKWITYVIEKYRPEDRIVSDKGKVDWLTVCEYEATDWEIFEETKKTLYQKETYMDDNGMRGTGFKYNDVKEALKEFIVWLKENDIVMDYNRKAKEIFGEELLK